MFSANQIAGFLNHEFLQNKSIKQHHFLHADTNSQKLKVVRKCSKMFGLAIVKIWVWPFCYLDSKIDCISRINRWIKTKSEMGVASLIFCMLVQILIKTYLGGHSQKWIWPVWSQDFKIDYFSKMSRWNKRIFCMLVQIQER